MGVVSWLVKKGAESNAYSAGRSDALKYADRRADLTADLMPHYRRGWDEGVAERGAKARAKASERRRADKRMYEDSVDLV